FSSRRRHTRFSRDWSSDVCSSDLELPSDGGVERAGAEGGAVVALDWDVARRNRLQADRREQEREKKPHQGGNGARIRHTLKVGFRALKGNEPPPVLRGRAHPRIARGPAPFAPSRSSLL